MTPEPVELSGPSGDQAAATSAAGGGTSAGLQEHDQSGPGAGGAVSAASGPDGSQVCYSSRGVAERRHRSDDRQPAPARFPRRHGLASGGTAGHVEGLPALTRKFSVSPASQGADAPERRDNRERVLFVGNSGTSMRFLTAMVSSGPRPLSGSTACRECANGPSKTC